MSEVRITYGVVQHVPTGDYLAVKFANGRACGVKECKASPPVNNAGLEALTYDVGDVFDAFMEKARTEYVTVASRQMIEELCYRP